MPKKKTATISENLEKIEALVAQLEDDDVQLEEAFVAFEQGMKLTKEVQEALRQTEQKVQVLLEEDEDFELAEFDEDYNE